MGNMPLPSYYHLLNEWLLGAGQTIINLNLHVPHAPNTLLHAPHAQILIFSHHFFKKMN